jgi:hypothetical protein
MERTALPAFTEGDDILVTAQDGTTMEGAFTGYLPGRDRHTVCVTVRRQVGGTWPHGSAMPVDHAASMVPVTDANTTRTDPETPFASVAFDAAGSVEFTAQDQDFHYTLGARPAVDRELGRVRDNLYGLIAMITGHRLADLIDRPASIRCYHYQPDALTFDGQALDIPQHQSLINSRLCGLKQGLSLAAICHRRGF